MSDFPFREKSFPFRENGHIALSQVSPMSDFPFRETRHIGHGRGGQHRKRGNTMTDPEAWLRGQLAQRANRYALQMERLLGSSNGAEPDDDGLVLQS
jgi:hypothetical protein